MIRMPGEPGQTLPRLSAVTWRSMTLATTSLDGLNPEQRRAVFGLGSDQVGVDGFGTTGLPIPVHRDPIGWLCNGRRGLVVVDWSMAPFALGGLLLEAEDAEHRRDLLRRLTPTPPTIVISNRRAAA